MKTVIFNSYKVPHHARKRERWERTTSWCKRRRWSRFRVWDCAHIDPALDLTILLQEEAEGPRSIPDPFQIFLMHPSTSHISSQHTALRWPQTPSILLAGSSCCWASFTDVLKLEPFFHSVHSCICSGLWGLVLRCSQPNQLNTCPVPNLCNIATLR
jgi:hypothetical protein